MRLSILILAIIFFAGCSVKPSKKVETAAKIYIENILVDEKYSAKKDTVEILRNEIFKKYNFSKEEYKKLFDDLSSDKESWDSFFKLAGSYLDTLKARKQLN